MISKKAEISLSLFLIVSLATGFVPKANADDSAPRPPSFSPSTVDVYSVSRIAQEFVAEANSQQQQIFGWGAFYYAITNDGGFEVISAPPTQTAPDTVSISENLYAGESYNNGLTFSWGSGDSAESFSCSTEFTTIQEGSYPSSVMPAFCGFPPGDDVTATPTAQNVSINDLGSGQTATSATQTYLRHNYPVLFDYGRTIGVKYQTSSTVQVSVGSSGKGENIDVTYQRTGSIFGVVAGDQTANFLDGLICKEFGIGDSSYDLCANAAIYKDGQTYYIYFPGNTQIGGWAPAAVRVAETKNFSPTNSSITRPLNSDIVYLSPTKCKTIYSSSFFKDKVETVCRTYGLSADGRMGEGIYYTSDSSWGIGFIIIGFALGALIGVAFPGLIEAINIELAAFGLDLTTISAISTTFQVATLTDPVLQAASAPGSLGTVETSNNLGVGAWTWSGGFDVTALPSPAPTSTPLVLCSFVTTSTPLTWGGGNCRSAPNLNFQNITPGTIENIPSVTSYSGTVNFQCNSSGGWDYLGESCKAPNGPGVYLEIY